MFLLVGNRMIDIGFKNILCSFDEKSKFVWTMQNSMQSYHCIAINYHQHVVFHCW